MKRAGLNIHVIGAGGHAKCIIAALRESGHGIAAVYDDDPSKWGKAFMGIKVTGPVSSLASVNSPHAVIAIGDNSARRRIAKRFASAIWMTVIHPFVSVDPSAQIGAGSVVLAGAVIQPGATIGEHCIINSGSVIGHDCFIGDYVHVSVGSVGGGARLGEGVFLGVGSTVIPEISIGPWCVIGAGAVVISDLEPCVEAVGVPARPLKRLECA